MMAEEQSAKTEQNWTPFPQPGWACEESQAVDAMFDSALRLQQDGRPAEAARLYEQILRINPRHADSLHLLGMVAWQAQRADVAIGLIGRAISINGRSAIYHSNLGTIVQAQGRLVEAKICYQRALELDPQLAEVQMNLALLEMIAGHVEEAIVGFRRAAELKPTLAEAWTNLGNALQSKGQLEEAEEDFLRSLALKPDLAETHYNLGNVYQDQKRYGEAVKAYQQAIQLRPGLAQAWTNLGNVHHKLEHLDEAVRCERRAIEINPLLVEAHYNLGNVLAHQKKNDEAAAAFEQALRLNPALTKAHNNLGNVYRGMERLEEAVAQYRQIPSGDPEFGGAYNNMGLALLSLGLYDEAEQAVRQTLSFAPTLSEAWCNLGVVFHAQNRLDEAMECYLRAQRLKPDLAKVRMNVGLIYLVRGQLEEGWKYYEWRWQNAPMVERGFPQPMWRGEPLEGARILLHAEQGYGDTMQFMRYAPMVAAAGGTVILEVQERAVRMAQELEGVTEVVQAGDPLPPFDWHVPLLSLPTAFGTTLETIPNRTPYLHVPEAARQKLADGLIWPSTGLRVGLAWAGNPTYRHDRYRFRSIDLAQFASLFELEDVHFYSLQLGPETAQLAKAPGPIVDLARLTSDMADTAAAIERMDLVISVDTSVAHLAGGLAVPTWVPLPKTPDWRWLLDREDSPWYPEMRLFRQPEAGDWATVLGRMRTELEALVENRKSASRD